MSALLGNRHETPDPENGHHHSGDTEQGRSHVSRYWQIASLTVMEWLLLVCAAGCDKSMRVSGPYEQVYATARDAMLRADFALESGARGTYGDAPAEGRIDFRSVEQKGKFEPRRFVTLTISPRGDDEQRERTITVDGWAYSWMSVVTGGLLRSDQEDLERRALDALQIAFGSAP